MGNLLSVLDSKNTVLISSLFPCILCFSESLYSDEIVKLCEIVTQHCAFSFIFSYGFTYVYRSPTTWLICPDVPGLSSPSYAEMLMCALELLLLVFAAIRTSIILILVAIGRNWRPVLRGYKKKSGRVGKQKWWRKKVGGMKLGVGLDRSSLFQYLLKHMIFMGYENI
ncbi:NADH-ubiquinone oxidoreductase chain 4L [Striga asiatica]|uniref:NADH-ubiquinone oxidoreductase chain 4L n=1 Tax=Striga asiatica TaxID=4170 RepID=A0A5A7PF89_STRAF|nr:NADH-ubiquinone oxidoreductase chain 4L [Striga asiatica]